MNKSMMDNLIDIQFVINYNIRNCIRIEQKVSQLLRFKVNANTERIYMCSIPRMNVKTCH